MPGKFFDKKLCRNLLVLSENNYFEPKYENESIENRH
jgi:hypothetical protein